MAIAHPHSYFYRRELTGLEAWVHLFAQAWETLELGPEDLSIEGLENFGGAVAEQHGGEDPAVVAGRLYPACGECYDQVYPAFTVTPLPAAAAPLPVVDGDVPF